MWKRPLVAVALTSLLLGSSLLSACARLDVSDGLESVADDVTVGLIADPPDTPTPLPEPTAIPQVVPTAGPAVVDLDFSQQPNSIEIIPGDDNSPLSVATVTPVPDGGGTVDTAVATLTPVPQSQVQPTAVPAPVSSSTTVTAGGYQPDVPAGNGLNIRDSPNGDVIGVLFEDEQITVVGEALRIGSTTWAKIEPLGEADWTTGWVAFQYLRTPGSTGSFPTATPDPEASPTATPDPDASPTATPDPDASPTATPDPDATATVTPTPDPDATATPDVTATPTTAPTVEATEGTFGVTLGTQTIKADVSGLGAPMYPEPDFDSRAIQFVPALGEVQIVNTQGVYTDGSSLVQVSYEGVTGWINPEFFG